MDDILVFNGSGDAHFIFEKLFDVRVFEHGFGDAFDCVEGEGVGILGQVNLSERALADYFLENKLFDFEGELFKFHSALLKEINKYFTF